MVGFGFINQAHPWFRGIKWDELYQIEAAFLPEVNGELDTQNFEKFEEVRRHSLSGRISVYKQYSSNYLNLCHDMHPCSRKGLANFDEDIGFSVC